MSSMAAPPFITYHGKAAVVFDDYDKGSSINEKVINDVSDQLQYGY